MSIEPDSIDCNKKKDIDMEDFWKASLKAGRPVAIVGFLIWVLLTFLFEEEMLSLFSTGQQFFLVILIVSFLMICLLAAIILWKEKEGTKQNEGNKAVFNKSTIKGDVVLGDKKINQENGNGE